MLNKLTTLALAGMATSTVAVTTTSTAQAVTITLDSQDYEVDLVEGSFLDLAASLEQTPWWQQDTIASNAASQFALACQDGCLPNDLQGVVSGPLFAYDLQIPTGSVVYETYDAAGATLAGTIPSTTAGTYAIAAPIEVIPEPLTLLGSAAALGVGILMKRRYSL
ncbi:MAG: PEP-CTERM sorting domain-containing protein [Cyanobacteria bacterium J06559_3]